MLRAIEVLKGLGVGMYTYGALTMALDYPFDLVI